VKQEKKHTFVVLALFKDIPSEEEFPRLFGDIFRTVKSKAERPVCDAPSAHAAVYLLTGRKCVAISGKCPLSFEHLFKPL